MATVGVVGLGDMGSGLAKNLIAAGFETRGFDLSEKRMADFKALGGIAARDPADAGTGADVVFVMVMNGDQVKSVVFGGRIYLSLIFLASNSMTFSSASSAARAPSASALSQAMTSRS